MTFKCPKCGLQKPLIDSVPKGGQLWCSNDSQSYNTLCDRWKANPKLRVWWRAQPTKVQEQWFRKWQGLTPKERFQMIQYAERYIESLEEMEDEIDQFITFKQWRREYKLDNQQATEEVIEKEWKDTIEECRDECIKRRGQWLAPTFVGVERRVRKSRKQEIMTSRFSGVENEESLKQLLAGGRSRLQQAGADIKGAIISRQNEGPQIDARPVDMPQRAQAQPLFDDLIRREVVISWMYCSMGCQALICNK